MSTSFSQPRSPLDRGMPMGVDFSVLVQMSFKGDLEGFLASWDYTFTAREKQPDEDLLFCLLETQLRACKALGPAFVVFDGA